MNDGNDGDDGNERLETDGGTSDSAPGSGIQKMLPSRETVLPATLVAVVVATVGVAVTLLLRPTPLAETEFGRAFQAFLASLSVPVWFVGQAVGAVALVFVFAALVGVWRSSSSSVDPAADEATAGERAGEDSESGPDAPEAGRELDRMLTTLRDAAENGAVDDATARLSASLRDELEPSAVTVLARAEDCPVDEATRTLEDGTWTDDPRAAAFFGDVTPPWHVRLRDVLGATPATVRQAEHVVAELERILDESESRVDDAAEEGETAPERGGVDLAPWQTRHSATGDDVVRDAAAVGVSAESSSDGDTHAGRVQVRSVGNAAGLLAVAVGVGTATPLAVLLGILGVVYGLLDRVTTTPTAAVEITREVGSGHPSPGDVVEVRLTVRNTGDESLPDVRVVDGVPQPLPVLEGSPGIHTALRPGESDTLTYTVRAKRGTFAFGDAAVIRRNLAGTNAVTDALAPETPIRCSTLLEAFPLHDQSRARAGQSPTDSGGEGIEFHATREYRRGDPPGRIDWNQLAKTGELTTIQYRDQGTATVVLLIDARDAVTASSDPSELDGLDLSVYAAERALLALLEQRVEVGVLVYDGSEIQHEPPDAAGPQRSRLTAALGDVSNRYDAVTEADVAASRTTTATDRPLEQVRKQLPSGAAVVLFSPAVDEFPLTASRTLRGAGHATTVFSPETVGDESLGQRTSRLERACLLESVRETGAYVVDWDTDESIETAVTRVAGRHGP